MKIAELKASFDSAIQPDPHQPIATCAQAWSLFKEFLQAFPEDENCEEFGFSFSRAKAEDGKTSKTDSNLFEVYFGRLIDAKKNLEWQTAEIDFYYRFEMNAYLSRLLAALPKEDVETAYCLTEGLPVIQQKRMEVLDFADRQNKIWEEIKKLKPASTSYHFWIW